MSASAPVVAPAPTPAPAPAHPATSQMAPQVALAQKNIVLSVPSQNVPAQPVATQTESIASPGAVAPCFCRRQQTHPGSANHQSNP